MTSGLLLDVAQEFEGSKEALRRSKEELEQRLEEGRGWNEKSAEEVEALEKELAELRVKEEELPREVRLCDSVEGVCVARRTWLAAAASDTLLAAWHLAHDSWRRCSGRRRS